MLNDGSLNASNFGVEAAPGALLTAAPPAPSEFAVSSEIAVTLTPGATLYAVARVGSRHAAGATLEAYDPARWTAYAIPMPELGTGYGVYAADFPALPAGVYEVDVYEQAGASPSRAADGLPAFTGSLQWDGTAEVGLSAIKTKTDNLPASPAAVGSAMTLSAAGLDAIAIGGGTATEVLRVLAAAVAGKVVEVINGDGTKTTTIFDFKDDATIRITSIETSTSRTPTVLD